MENSLPLIRKPSSRMEMGKCRGRALKFKKRSDNGPLKETILFRVFPVRLRIGFQNDIGVCVCVPVRV